MSQKIQLIRELYRYTEQKKNPGKYPIKIALYIDGVWHRKAVGHCVEPHQWNDDRQEVIDHPQAKFINAAVKREYDKAYASLLECYKKQDAVTPAVLGKLKKVNRKFFEFCRAVRPDKETKTMIGRIQNFWGREPEFHEIDMDFMRAFDAWHKEMILTKAGSLKQRYDHNTLNTTGRYFRRICLQAEKEGYLPKNPYNKEHGGYKVAPYIDPEVIFLNELERQRVLDLFRRKRDAHLRQGAKSYTDEYKTLVYFVFAIHSGFRYSDWGKFDPKLHVQEDGFIRLRAHKNDEWVTMEIGPTLMEAITEIRKIGRFTLNNGDTNTCLRLLAPQAKIEKDVTSHVGRHSFGTLCATIGLKVEHCAYFMGITVEQAETYYHLTGEARKEQTKALAAV